jgi:RecA-family ATPase
MSVTPEKLAEAAARIRAASPRWTLAFEREADLLLYDPATQALVERELREVWRQLDPKGSIPTIQRERILGNAKEKARANDANGHDNGATTVDDHAAIIPPEMKDKLEIFNWKNALNGGDEHKQEKPEPKPREAPKSDEGHTSTSENVNTGSANTGTTAPLVWIKMDNWDTEPEPEREWAVFNRFPLYQPSLFSGEGGAGKSLLMQMLCSAAPISRGWLDVVPEYGPGWLIDAEEDEKELHRREITISRHYEVPIADMIKGGLRLMSLAGHDAIMASVSRGGKVEPTALYKQIFEEAGDVKPKIITIASAANVYAGNENVRTEVQQFCGLLTRMAIASHSAVILVSQPSNTGITSETGLSGTTQWHNAVRARAYLKSRKAEPGEQPDDDLREIVFKKNQYGKKADSLVLKWRDGLFLPLSGVSSLDKAAVYEKASEVFLKLLRRFNEQNQDVGAVSGTNYAPSVFARHSDAAGLTSQQLAKAMQQLIDNKTIIVEPFGPPSKRRKRLVIA